ncbi:hypothetical protein ACNKU7_08730 [Microbulbifer sp. SA54]|uniref:hypothetical protein n=1 Tax=Microbulbifer sp. SA54 TaxID=3401577 RepID=UPI003AB0212E
MKKYAFFGCTLLVLSTVSSASDLMEEKLKRMNGLNPQNVNVSGLQAMIGSLAMEACAQVLRNYALSIGIEDINKQDEFIEMMKENGELESCAHDKIVQSYPEDPSYYN